MTDRTISLLMLFVSALVATGILLAMLVSATQPAAQQGAWMAVLLAVLCQVIVLFLGRRYILIHEVARSTLRSAVFVSVTVVLSLLGAAAVAWVVQWSSGGALFSPTLTLLLWFVLLWVAVRQQQKWHAAEKSRVR